MHNLGHRKPQRVQKNQLTQAVAKEVRKRNEAESDLEVARQSSADLGEQLTSANAEITRLGQFENRAASAQTTIQALTSRLEQTKAEFRSVLQKFILVCYPELRTWILHQMFLDSDLLVLKTSVDNEISGPLLLSHDEKTNKIIGCRKFWGGVVASDTYRQDCVVHASIRNNTRNRHRIQLVAVPARLQIEDRRNGGKKRKKYFMRVLIFKAPN